MKFKDNLKRIREQRNLTQDDIAREIGISRQSVSKWENGVAEPDLDTIKQLCSILNCSLDELIYGEQPSKPVLSSTQKAKRNNDIAMAVLIVLLFIFIVALTLFLCNFISSIVDYNRAMTSEGMDPSVGLTGIFKITELQGCSERLAIKTYGKNVVEANPNLIESVKATILSHYTLQGDLYWYNLVGPVTIQYWSLVLAIGIVFFIIPTVIVFVTTIKNNKKYLKELDRPSI